MELSTCAPMETIVQKLLKGLGSVQLEPMLRQKSELPSWMSVTHAQNTSIACRELVTDTSISVIKPVKVVSIAHKAALALSSVSQDTIADQVLLARKHLPMIM